MIEPLELPFQKRGKISKLLRRRSLSFQKNEVHQKKGTSSKLLFVGSECQKAIVLNTNNEKKSNDEQFKAVVRVEGNRIITRNLYFDESSHAQFFLARLLSISSLSQRIIEHEYAVHNNEVLGRGSFGIVVAGKRKLTGEDVAIKMIQTNRLDNDGQLEMVQKEINIHKKLSHKHIVRLHDVFTSSSRINIVMERLRGGELFDTLIARERFTEKDSAVAVKQLVEALHYLHGNSICHMDVKPENLVYACPTDDRSLKLIDMGFACEIGKPTVPGGSPEYIAPEVINDPEAVMEHGNIPASDMWSVGVLLYFLLVGSLPFKGESQEETLELVASGNYSMDDHAWDSISEDAKSLVRGLLRVNVKKRLSAEQVLQHEWIISEGGENGQISVSEVVKQRLKSYRIRNVWKKAMNTVVAGLRLLKPFLKRKEETVKEVSARKDGNLGVKTVERKATANALKEFSAKNKFKKAIRLARFAEAFATGANLPTKTHDSVTKRKELEVLVNNVDEKTWERLMKVCRYERIELQAHQILINEGDTVVHVFAIESGECQLPNGRLLGPSTIVSSRKQDVWATSIKAVQTCSVLQLKQEVVTQLFEDSSGVYASFLKGVPLFKGLEENAVKEISSNLTTHQFKPEEKIFNQGDHGDTFYIIEEGSAIVKILLNSNEGKTWKPVAKLNSGDYFGEAAILQNTPRTATVEAASEGCRCAVLSRNIFLQVAEHKEAADLLRKTMRKYQHSPQETLSKSD